jgi:hypothetical protein
MNYKLLVAAGLFASASQAALAAPPTTFEAQSPVAAAPSGRTASGSFGDFVWEASNNIVGRTSTATLAGGGDPRFFANLPKYHGVVGLLMETNAGNFVCSGTLAGNRNSIVSAAHCFADEFGQLNVNRTTAWFYNGTDPDVAFQSNPFNSPNIVFREISRYEIAPGYTGEVIDQHDVAVIRLQSGAPSWAPVADIDFTSPLTGAEINIAGLGRRSDVGGNFGANLGTGRLRQGDNRFDFSLGDADFNGFWTDRDANGENFFGFAEVDQVWITDFDNGLLTNDASCRIAFGTGAIAALNPKFCNQGTVNEVGVAGGDSGGPNFLNGKLVAVNSFGLSFGPDFGDIRAGLNTSFGEFSGMAPVGGVNEAFVRASLAVPEPASWAMLIAGFGLVGGTLRRRRAALA